jgi:hypothetical protein
MSAARGKFAPHLPHTLFASICREFCISPPAARKQVLEGQK